MPNRALTILTSAATVGLLGAGNVALGEADPVRHRPGEVIVTFAGRPDRAAFAATMARAYGSGRIDRTLAAVGRPRTALIKFSKELPVEQMVTRLKAMPGVVEAQPNRLSRMPDAGHFVTREGGRPSYRARGGGATADPTQAAHPGVRGGGATAAAATGGSGAPYYPNDPGAYWQRAFYWMDAEAIWPEKALSPMVALVGFGVDYRHPDLVGSILKGTDWVNADADPDDDNGYGTHMAGIVAARMNNKIGLTGLANGKVLAIKIMDSEGWCTEFDCAGGILEAANNPAVKVILLAFSVGGFDSNLIRDAVQTAVSKGQLVVAPVAGEGVNAVSYPAYYSHPSYPTLAPGVISVAATGMQTFYDCPGPGCYWYYDDTCRSIYSDYGDWVTTDAPGDGIYSTLPTHPFLHQRWGAPLNYGYLTGTQQAAAQVAAAAARAWSVLPAGTTAAQIKARVVSRGYHHVSYGQTYSVDTDGDGTLDTPCQPAEASDATVTPVLSSLMGRTAVYGRVYDAHGGLTLPGPATVTATLAGVPKGYGGRTEDSNFPRFGVVNLPTDNSTPYELKVSAVGYTAGPVPFASLLLDDCGGHPYCAQFIRSLSLPRNLPGQIHVVTDYDRDDLDTHLFTPSSAPIQCDVGITPISSLFCFLGSLKTAPFARLLNHPSGNDFLRSELLSLKMPLYPTVTGTPYRIVLADYDNNFIRTSGARTRLWTGGKILSRVDAMSGNVTQNDCTYGGGANTCGAFWVGDLSGTGVFTPKAIFGTLSAAGPAGVLPYGAARGVGSGPNP